jgi:hypothetical protein
MQANVSCCCTAGLAALACCWGEELARHSVGPSGHTLQGSHTSNAPLHASQEGMQSEQDCYSLLGDRSGRARLSL